MLNTLLLKVFILLLFCQACVKIDNSITVKNIHCALLDSTMASKSIQIDTSDNFFELLQPLEMCIQMQYSLSQTKEFREKNRDEQIQIYKAYIAADVQNFTENEAFILKKEMKYAMEMVYKVFPNIQLPSQINLIKTESKNYGKTVFYTREDNIIIPAPQIHLGNEKLLREVLIHEIFHIYTRFNPDKKEKLFAVIGFNKIDSVVFSSFVQERVMYNPDATNYHYAIDLKVKGKSIKAVPIIYSNYPTYERGVPFFQHIVFQLFPIEKINDSSSIYKINVPNVGLNPESLSDFKQQIGKNTNYIIHPEEVAADNFKLLILSKGNTDKYPSPKIMQDIYNIIAS